ncbi:MAG: RagB/SusD family nutrient uptake outer membrane protein [Dysgonamonadaceae bacterium]|nr:RagB/SusD family nutrient uptake outer membrane protein [Dysgonamonadaceae bacterium]
MKQFKIFVVLLFTLGTVLFSSGCTDWLDVEPKDMVLEDKQFSTELRTNSVLNGIYRLMTHNNLYGQNLTQTYTEYLAHYYNFFRAGGTGLTSLPGDMQLWREVSLFQHYDRPSDIAERVWNNAYRAIFEINLFIRNVEERDDVMRESRRNVLLGEAYALRAFMHFDLFRLFGPIHSSNYAGFDPAAVSIPYNNTAATVPHQPQTATRFLELVLTDLATAEKLLENDPIRTTGRNDNFRLNTLNTSLTTEIIFAEYYRNRKMNYYAVKALQARVLLQKMEYDQAANVAEALLAEIYERRVFSWTPINTVVSQGNFIFYQEVLFGITNPNLYTSWTDMFGGSFPGRVHVVAQPNLLNNIFAEFGGEPIATYLQSDIRAAQWIEVAVQGETGTGGGATFVSRRLRRPAVQDWAAADTDTPPYYLNFQPLMRKSELYLIQAEAAIATNQLPKAVEMIREVMRARGYQALFLDTILPMNASVQEIQNVLEREVYREFVGEGQAFFYLKRNAKPRIFAGFETGHTQLGNITNTYVVPTPNSELITN